LYPVKQAFEAATGVQRRKFTTQTARRQFAALGFELVTAGQVRPATITAKGKARSGDGPVTLISEQPVSSGDWHTEARVQAMVVAHLVHDGWEVMS
jgi:hypothetical protein